MKKPKRVTHKDLLRLVAYTGKLAIQSRTKILKAGANGPDYRFGYAVMRKIGGRVFVATVAINERIAT